MPTKKHTIQIATLTLLALLGEVAVYTAFVTPNPMITRFILGASGITTIVLFSFLAKAWLKFRR